MCVVDADYKWMGNKDDGEPTLGATAAGAMKVAEELKAKTVCTVYAVPCREIENLLPSGLVLECVEAKDRGDMLQYCLQASRLGLFGGGPGVDRLDLKNGLCRKDYETVPDAHPEHRYLARVFAEHKNRAPTPARGWCGDDARRCDGGQACECILFKGVGKRLLAHAADKVEKMTPQKVAEHLLASGQPHEPAWIEIGSLLFAWGCAYPRTRT